MTIKFIKDISKTGHPYKKGDTVENAEAIFGPAQAKYLLETGHAESVGEKVELAVAPPTQTPEKTA